MNYLNALCRFSVLLIVFSTTQVIAQSTVLERPSISSYAFKDYPDGTRTGYFSMEGNYSLKNLHRIEQLFLDIEGVIHASVLDKSEEKGSHVVFLKTTGNFASKNWIESVVQERLSNYIYQ